MYIVFHGIPYTCVSQISVIKRVGGDELYIHVHVCGCKSDNVWYKCEGCYIVSSFCSSLKS